MESPTLFDQAVALTQASDDGFAGHTSAAYGNMVGPFGGVTAAQAIQAVLLHPKRLGDPAALTVNFCAAVADGPFSITARPARTNRSTQHWVIDMQQDGETVLTATAVTAVRRETWGATECNPPVVPAPADVNRVDGPFGVEWINRYELRFAEGGFPAQWDGAEHESSRTQLWVRDNPPRPLDFASLTAMSDIFYPRIWRRRATPVAAGTVTLSIYFHTDSDQLESMGSDYLLGQAQAQAYRNGYFDHSGQLWSETGDLLVTTHQMVYYKQ